MHPGGSEQLPWTQLFQAQRAKITEKKKRELEDFFTRKKEEKQGIYMVFFQYDREKNLISFQGVPWELGHKQMLQIACA